MTCISLKLDKEISGYDHRDATHREIAQHISLTNPMSTLAEAIRGEIDLRPMYDAALPENRTYSMEIDIK